jgi:hypothetical protein
MESVVQLQRAVIAPPDSVEMFTTRNMRSVPPVPPTGVPQGAPDGMAPWGFITHFVEQRRAQRTPHTIGPEVAPIRGAGLDSSGRNFDVSA